ncbi:MULTISPECIES: hypothetical protein [unclassified Caballeronia]|uniref:hypothetical protein n=1 Tax=unclassified Caballeronia TaxID=2646786 RepID=UPI0013EC82A0|nr:MULTISPECIES: hypothetical protein [unclassified Caballeronia]
MKHFAKLGNGKRSRASKVRHIIELWWGGGAWNYHDLTAATGAAFQYDEYAMGASGYVFFAQGTQHVNCFDRLDDSTTRVS